MDGMERRVREGLANWVKSKGWELLADDFEGFMVFEDGDGIAFAGVAYTVGGDFPFCDRCPIDFERALIDWMSQESKEGRYRMDTFECVAKGSKLIIRHGKSVLGDEEVDYAES